MRDIVDPIRGSQGSSRELQDVPRPSFATNGLREHEVITPGCGPEHLGGYRHRGGGAAERRGACAGVSPIDPAQADDELVGILRRRAPTGRQDGRWAALCVRRRGVAPCRGPPPARFLRGGGEVGGNGDLLRPEPVAEDDVDRRTSGEPRHPRAGEDRDSSSRPDRSRAPGLASARNSLRSSSAFCAVSH